VLHHVQRMQLEAVDADPQPAVEAGVTVGCALAGQAAVIYWWMHVGMMGGGNLFPILNGGESAVLFCFTFLYLVFAGPGAFSVDGALASRKQSA